MRNWFCFQRLGGAPSASRRQSLLSVFGMGLLAAGTRAIADEPAIVQPPAAGHSDFMTRAHEMRSLALANGDQGYGAVIVKDGHIVGQSPSRVIANRDPTAHAETEAIRDACRRMGTRDLSGCVMYSTTAACAMCETAAYWANVKHMYAGSAVTDQGVPRYGGC